MLVTEHPDLAVLKKKYETEILVKEGIIKELRSIILEKNQNKQSPDRQQLVGQSRYTLGLKKTIKANKKKVAVLTDGYLSNKSTMCM